VILQRVDLFVERVDQIEKALGHLVDGVSLPEELLELAGLDEVLPDA